MKFVLLYLLLLKATTTSFGGLSSLPVLREDLVIRHQFLTDRQLNLAVTAGRAGPGPNGLYVVSVGYLVAGMPGAWLGWLAMATPAFLIIPLAHFRGRSCRSAEDQRGDQGFDRGQCRIAGSDHAEARSRSFDRLRINRHRGCELSDIFF